MSSHVGEATASPSPLEGLDKRQELQFRQEATKRTLLDLFEAGDNEGLLNAAMLLNSLWHQQTAIARWFANEAAENLGEAWQASSRR